MTKSIIIITLLGSLFCTDHDVISVKAPQFNLMISIDENVYLDNQFVGWTCKRTVQIVGGVQTVISYGKTDDDMKSEKMDLSENTIDELIEFAQSAEKRSIKPLVFDHFIRIQVHIDDGALGSVDCAANF